MSSNLTHLALVCRSLYPAPCHRGVPAVADCLAPPPTALLPSNAVWGCQGSGTPNGGNCSAVCDVNYMPTQSSSTLTVVCTNGAWASSTIGSLSCELVPQVPREFIACR